MQPDVPRQPALSPHYAFVVQFSAETQVEAERLVGRVEHVVSGQAAHFHSLEALLAFLARILKQVKEESTTCDTTNSNEQVLHYFKAADAAKQITQFQYDAATQLVK